MSKRGYIQTKYMTISPKGGIEDNYNDDFLPVDEKITELIHSDDSCIIILQGKPGTGKTSYIRNLINENKDVIFYWLDASMFNYIDVAFFAFAQLQDNYTVKLGSEPVARTVLSRCHSHNVKVVLSFAGTWLDKRFVTLSCDAAKRNIFVESVVKLVDDYGFDGIDNDWEYPSSKDGSQRGNLLLMRQLSNEMHAPGVNRTLSMAITPGIYEGSYTQGLDPGVFDCCDWFGSMTYDDDQPHSPYSMLETSFDFWVTRNKMPLKKFVGGIPCYGRGSRSEGYWDKSKSYRNLVVNYGADPDSDTVETDGYVTNYNGRKTVSRKVQYLLEKNAGGYFFWEADQDMKDDRSLLRTASMTVDDYCNE